MSIPFDPGRPETRCKDMIRDGDQALHMGLVIQHHLPQPDLDGSHLTTYGGQKTCSGEGTVPTLPCGVAIENETFHF